MKVARSGLALHSFVFASLSPILPRASALLSPLKCCETEQPNFAAVNLMVLADFMVGLAGFEPTTYGFLRMTAPEFLHSLSGSALSERDTAPIG